MFYKTNGPNDTAFLHRFGHNVFNFLVQEALFSPNPQYFCNEGVFSSWGYLSTTAKAWNERSILGWPTSFKTKRVVLSQGSTFNFLPCETVSVGTENVVPYVVTKLPWRTLGFEHPNVNLSQASNLIQTLSPNSNGALVYGSHPQRAYCITCEPLSSVLSLTLWSNKEETKIISSTRLELHDATNHFNVLLSYKFMP